MKRTSLILMILLGAVSVFARPALQGTRRIQQPDGSFVTVRLVGDEYRSFHTTADGYSLVRNSEGYFVYARMGADGQLAPTKLVAHDAEARSAEDVSYLQQTGKRLTPQFMPEMEQMRRRNRSNAGADASGVGVKAPMYNYSEFRGLVLLVEYNDCPFTYDDYREIMDHMINDDDYTGEERTNLKSGRTTVNCTGSMRDYFRDNSNGIFVPHFDVVGPVQINRSQFDGRSKVAQLLSDACTAADSQVNFKDYDVNNDGVVDMVYFIFSGLPSYIQGNDERLLWPHQYDMRYYGTRVRKDNVVLGRYACSTELFGYSDWQILEGIGTMCHEFSHVLGLPDFYDTDTEDDIPGTCENPGLWSVMANGADGNYGRTPISFSLFERYALGFATPEKLGESESYSLEAVTSSNTGFRIDTPVKKEYFLIENRQKVKWDSVLPGHGMLIWRVDSTNSTVWTTTNQVNAIPEHPYYQLVRAAGLKTQTVEGKEIILDSSTDPFPGTKRITTIDNETSPANLLTWGGKQSPYGLRNIKESGGVISFDIYDALVIQSVSLDETLTMATGTSVQMTAECQPGNLSATFAWESDNTDVATVSEEGVVSAVAPGVAHITVTVNDKLTATCEVRVLEAVPVAGISEFMALQPGTLATLTLTDAHVLYVNENESGKEVYVRDASGTLAISGLGVDAVQSQMLNGVVGGWRNEVYGMPRLTIVDAMTDVSAIQVADADAVKPLSVHISQLSAENLADLVLLEKVEIVRDGNTFAVFGDKRIRLWNYFQIKSPKISLPSKTDGKRFDVYGIYGMDALTNGQSTEEIYLLQSPAEVSYNAPETLALSDVALQPGDSLRLVVLPEGVDIWPVWTSSDEQVVTVSPDGVVAALANGVATITVEDRETHLVAQCQVVVDELNGIADARSQVFVSRSRITGLTPGETVTVTTPHGIVLQQAPADTKGCVRLSLPSRSPALYVIKMGQKTVKVVF